MTICFTPACNEVAAHFSPTGKSAYCIEHARCTRCGRFIEEYVRTTIGVGCVIWCCPCITERDRELAHKVPLPIPSTTPTVDRSNHVKPVQVPHVPKREEAKEMSLWK